MTITTAAGVDMQATPDEAELAELYAEDTGHAPAVCLALIRGGITPQAGGFRGASVPALNKHYPYTSSATVQA